MCTDRGYHEADNFHAEIYKGHMIHIEWDHAEWDTHKDVRPCIWIVHRIEFQDADMSTLVRVASSERVDLFHTARIEAMQTVTTLLGHTVAQP